MTVLPRPPSAEPPAALLEVSPARSLPRLLAWLTLLPLAALVGAFWAVGNVARQTEAARDAEALAAQSVQMYGIVQRALSVPPPAPPTAPAAVILSRPTIPESTPNSTAPGGASPTAPAPVAPLSPPVTTAPAPPDPAAQVTAARSQWEPVLHQMQATQARLLSDFPAQSRAMDTAWTPFQSAFLNNPPLDWDTAQGMEQASDALAGTLARRAQRTETLARWLLGWGVAALLGLLWQAIAVSDRLRRTDTELHALRQERLMTGKVLDSTSEGIYCTDREGACTFINPSGAQMLGYQPKELLGKEMHALVHHTRPDGRPYPASDCPIVLAAQGGFGCRRDDEVLWRRDGTSFPAEYASAPVLANGQVQGVVVTFTDISERKEAEGLRDDLIGMIVHDLRTPLTSLLSGLQTLDAMGELTPAQQEILNISVQGGQTLLALVNDLLDINKMEAGSVTLERLPLAPAAVIEQALLSIAPLARENELRVARHVAPDLPRIIADEDKLRRTLVNLLGNAVKFTPKGGIVTVSAQFDPVEGAIVFAVGDTGEGIPAHAVKRVFEKFGQVESRKAGRKMSTGLGLTFCKLVAEAHGGRIWVESKLGKGSRFLFTIPAPGVLTAARPGNQDMAANVTSG